MTVSREAACQLADVLHVAHIELRSWRKVSAKHYPDVAPGTLCRIANEGGAWLPKDRKILRALGLLEPRRHADEHTKRVRRHIRAIAKDTADAVVRRQPVKKEYQAATKEIQHG